MNIMDPQQTILSREIGYVLQHVQALTIELQRISEDNTLGSKRDPTKIKERVLSNLNDQLHDDSVTIGLIIDKYAYNCTPK